jgi:predicted secreted protein
MTSEEAQQQAQAEGLTLLVGKSKAGYFGVRLDNPGQPSKPYQAKVWRGGKEVALGSFATAEEAALCVARSPEGRAVAAERADAAAAAPLTSEEVRQQAQAEKLTLLVAETCSSGYFGVAHRPSQPSKPYQAKVHRCGSSVTLGSFATAEEAALCVARSPEGKAAAVRAASAVPLTSEQARQQARAEGLTLVVAENTTGYFGVYHRPSLPKPYQAKVHRDGKTVHLGTFATAEEAALRIARSPEGQAAARKPVGPAAAVRAATIRAPLTSEQARQQARAEGLTLVVAENTTGYFRVSLYHPGLLKLYQAKVHRDGKTVSLGTFATAEEAALCVARTPEGQAAARRAAARERQGTLPAVPSGAFGNEEEVVPPMPPGANGWDGLVLLEEHGLEERALRRACFLLACAERQEKELPKRQRMQ